jgi:hypothetical protein
VNKLRRVQFLQMSDVQGAIHDWKLENKVPYFIATKKLYLVRCLCLILLLLLLLLLCEK